jgi:hypothetical protein
MFPKGRSCDRFFVSTCNSGAGLWEALSTMPNKTEPAGGIVPILGRGYTLARIRTINSGCMSRDERKEFYSTKQENLVSYIVGKQEYASRMTVQLVRASLA